MQFRISSAPEITPRILKTTKTTKIVAQIPAQIVCARKLPTAIMRAPNDSPKVSMVAHQTTPPQAQGMMVNRVAATANNANSRGVNEGLRVFIFL
jgi:hypothetical protein